MLNPNKGATLQSVIITIVCTMKEISVYNHYNSFTFSPFVSDFDAYLFANGLGLHHEISPELLTRLKKEFEEKRYTTFNRNVPLHTRPHYTEVAFKEPKSIFGEHEEGLDYVYSDRMDQWDAEKADKAWEKTREFVKSKRKGDDDSVVSYYEASTAEAHEYYLTEYFGKEIELLHIQACVNMATGYPYLIYGFKEKA